MTTVCVEQQDQTQAFLREDAAARDRALALASFIVEAPAGAGKTELLTQRFLALLAQVEHPEEVVALTFTNKAATEMRDRILGSLELAASGKRPELPHKQKTFDISRTVLARDEEQGWQLREHPGRLKIATIDSLCANLVGQMPFLSRFGAQPGVSDDTEAYYTAAARETIGLIEDGGERGDIVAKALDYLDNNVGNLEKLLVSMLARRDQWLRHTYNGGADDLRAAAEAGLRELVSAALKEVASLIGPGIQQTLMPPVRYAAGNCEDFAHLANWKVPLTGELEELEHWLALSTLLLTGKGDRRLKLDKNLGFPAGAESKPFKEVMLTAAEGLPDAAVHALFRLRALPATTYAEEDWAVIDVFYQVLQLANAQLWLGFQQGGEVDFTAISQRAIAALGTESEPTNLALALDYRIRHLLIDEFQDTSPSQVELIEGLTRGWEEGDGRTLFLVGDPMQSIYRFRKADVGLFLRVQEHGIGSVQLETLRLYRNNRSAPAIVNWINQAFPHIFPATNNPTIGAVCYSASATDRADDPSAGVFTHAVLKEDGVDVEQRQAERVIALIDAARADNPQAEIAVLVRSRTHLATLVQEIRRSRPALRFQAVEIEGLAGRQPVQDLLTLTHALLHRANRVQWLAFLRAPWCGLTLADLHALCGKNHEKTVWQLMRDDALVGTLSADGQKRLLRVRSVLKDAFAHQGRWALARWVENVWRRLNCPACLAKPTDWQDVEAFFTLLEQMSANGNIEADSLEQKVGSLFSAADPDPDAQHLQMMTIHKSKGLEFDTVIVPGLHRLPPNPQGVLVRWESVLGPDDQEYLVPAAVKQKGEVNANAVLYDYLAGLDAEREAHETVRVLYVATTRAKHRLHLVGALERDDSDCKTPDRRALLHLLWKSDVVRASFEGDAELQGSNDAPDATAVAQETTPMTSYLVRLRADAMDVVAPGQMDSGAATLPIDDVLSAEADEGLRLASSVGTLVHRCLEIIGNAGLEGWDAARVSALEPAYRAWLCNQGLSEQDAVKGAALVVDAVTTTLASETGRWILQSRPTSHAELALSNVNPDENGAVAHHVIDRTFVDNDCRWIIDFKTLTGYSADDIVGLTERANTHRAQLDRYAGLFGDQSLPVRKAIFFPLQGVFIEVWDEDQASVA